MLEFFAILPLLSVFLFSVNNFYLKQNFPSVFTGKLSDFMACFFIPLYISCILSLIGWKTLKPRIFTSCLITLLIFSLVKLSEFASMILNTVIAYFLDFSQLGTSINNTDPSDLVALPMIFLAYYFALSRYKRT